MEDYQVRIEEGTGSREISPRMVDRERAVNVARRLLRWGVEAYVAKVGQPNTVVWPRLLSSSYRPTPTPTDGMAGDQDDEDDFPLF